MPQPGSRNLNTSVGDKSHIYGTRSVTSVDLFVSIFSRKEPLRFYSKEIWLIFLIQGVLLGGSLL